MENKIDTTPITTHGNGAQTTSNGVTNLINPKKKSRFLKTVDGDRKNDTEVLLAGLSEMLLKDMTLFILFQDSYPLASREAKEEIRMFVNQLSKEETNVSKLRDLIQWSQTAMRAREEGIINGYAFIDYCDGGLNQDALYDDLFTNVKSEMPIDDYINGKIKEEEMLEYLSESSYNYMIKRISSNRFLFEQCENEEALRLINNKLRNGEAAKEDYFNMFERIMKSVDKYKRINGVNITKSALDSGFTANLSKEDCVEEYNKNLDLERNGNNKFKFGHRWLNLVTGGGLESKQLMVYGAPSGNGKTSMMISSAIDMALYNPDVKHEHGYKPCVFYISAETGLNDIRGRYIKMLTGKDISWDDMQSGERCYLAEEEILELMLEANAILSRRTPVMIKFIQVPNNSYSKESIMRDIETLKSEGIQVVSVVADYIKGFKPMEATSENRLRIENIVGDLRALAIECDVAVITASQVKVEISNKISENRAGYKTSVIPKDCPDTVFSESKGVNDICDFGIIFAQTSDTYEKNDVTRAVKYTHLEALVVKTRAGQHNSARAFIPYAEGTQIAFQKDLDLFDMNNKPVWLTKGELEFKGDANMLSDDMNAIKGTGKLFKVEKKHSPVATAECNISREADVMDDMPTSGFANPALNAAMAA